MPDSPKPCPFCGVTAIGPTDCGGEDIHGNDAVAAVCWGCGAQGPFVTQTDRLPNFDSGPETTAASIAAWNRRA